MGGGIRAICESMAMTLSHHVRPSPLQSVSTKFYRSLGSVLHLTNAKITNLFPQQPRHFADPEDLQHPPAEFVLPSKPVSHSCSSQAQLSSVEACRHTVSHATDVPLLQHRTRPAYLPLAAPAMPSLSHTPNPEAP